jgi:uncharacterized protein DUF3887
MTAFWAGVKKPMALLFAASLAIPLFAQSPHQAESPRRAEPPQQAESPSRKIAREFAVNFTAGHFDAARKDFNKALTGVVSVAIMKSAGEQITARMGAFRSITSLRETKVDRFPSVAVVMEHEKGPVSVSVVFDSDGRVGSVVFDPLPEAVDPALERSARELLANLTSGRFDLVSAQFSDNMHRQLPPQELTELVRKMAITFGKFQSITEVRQRTESGNRVIELIAAYEKRPVKVSVVFDLDSKVAGIAIAPNQPGP